MKLHTKLSLALLIGLVLAVASAQYVQFQQAGKLISTLSESVIDVIRQREERFARNIFNSVERSVEGSLERGEMEKFSKLIEAQKSVEGLIEFSLYDRNGYISHSTETSRLRASLPEEIEQTVLNSNQIVMRHQGKFIEIYHPQIIDAYCVRCHMDWKPGGIGGVTSMKFSTDAFLQARTQAQQILEQVKKTFLMNSLLTLGGIVLFFLVTMYFCVNIFVRSPLNRISAGLKELSEGEAELTKRLEIVSHDELGHLADYFNIFMEKLQAMVGQVQSSGIQVTSSSTELAATAKEHEVTLKNQMDSTVRVSTALEKISFVSKELVKTMHQVTSMSQEAADYANSGQENLIRIREAMQEMELASKSISSRLETINEKTENITTVITTITKVSDQTNLLSLNAAIEAEKAGEFGRGFIVVAREIRRLADQTAIATLDIEQMVKEMQSAVSNGVMEMDTFIEKVHRNADEVGEISEQMNQIIEQVRSLTPNFESVSRAMDEQSENAAEINGEMATLSEEMQMIMESLHDSFQAIGQLNEASKGLQDEVCRFKVD